MTVATLVRRQSRGPALFLLGSLGVHAGNYAFNVVLARGLPPAGYAEVALSVATLLLAGFVGVGLQMATARVVAAEGPGSGMAVAWARRLGVIAFLGGSSLGLATLAALPYLMPKFDIRSPGPVLAVAVALPFAFVSGVGRGWLQGSGRFGRLAASFQVEMAVRLGSGVAAIVFGGGTTFALAGLTLSMMAASALAPLPRRLDDAEGQIAATDLWRALGPSVTLLAGEALVNHVDLLVAKSVFPAALAGTYAGIALLGRTVSFLTWPVVMVAFPLVAAAAATGRDAEWLIQRATRRVAVASGAAVLLGFAFDHRIVDFALGDRFASMSGLLGPYLAATALFTVAAARLALQVASGDARAGRVAAGFGGLTLFCLVLFHPSPAAMVWTQIGLNGCLLMVSGRRGRRVWP